MNINSASEHDLRQCYRALLRCYPGHFRDQFGLEMEEAFVDGLRDSRKAGSVRSIVFVIAAVADAFVSGLRERFSSHSRNPRMFQWMDVRYAFRLLRRSPVFTLLTVLVLSGGLGVSIFTFSFLHTAMLKPIPVVGGENVVSISRESGPNSGPFDLADVAALRASRTVRELGAYSAQNLVVDDAEHSRVIDATVAQWNMFEFTHTVPTLGRTFTHGDAMPGAEPVIVLGNRLWVAAFGSDASMVGKTIVLNGTSTRVIGVMPPGYGFPVASTAWTPLSSNALESTQPGKYFVQLYGRLAPGASADEAKTELTTLYRRARVTARTAVSADSAKALAVIDATAVASVQTFPMAQMGEDGPLMLAVLNVLAGLILLLACINVTNLLLARSNERVRETAVRLALGASRGRLIVQSMWESTLLCVAGGAVATAIAAWGLDAINTWANNNLEGNLAFWWVWGLDRSSLIAAALFVTGTIAVLGVAVSGRATSLQFVAVLKDGSTRSGSRREGRFARILVMTQVATVSVLMFFGVMAGIVAYRVANVSAGFDTNHLLSSSIELNGARYDSTASRTRLYGGVVNALGTAPAVNGIMMRANLADITSGAFAIDGQPPAAAGSSQRAYQLAISGALGTIGVTVPAGRGFDERDNERGTPVALVSHAFAEKYWPGISPLGRTISMANEKPAVVRTVVGVTSNYVFGPPLAKTRSAIAIYVPLPQSAARGAEVLFRHRGDVYAAHAALYRALRDEDSQMLPPDVQSYDEILGKTGLIARSTAKLFAACFAFALLIAVSGTYGLMARSIGQRTREIGVRRALGASDSAVVKLLLQQGGQQLGIGVLFSVPLMLVVGIGFARLFPVGTLLTVASGVIVAAVIISVVLLATYVPTRRAISVEIRDALWKE